jgi:hypothetical protein
MRLAEVPSLDEAMANYKDKTVKMRYLQDSMEATEVASGQRGMDKDINVEQVWQ